MVRFFLDRGAVDGEQLISPRLLSRMETTGSTPAARAGQQIGYGLHNYSSIHEHWVYRAHDGGVNGGITEFAYLPQAGVGHAIMVNSDDFATFMDISELVRNFETRNLVPTVVESSLQVSAEHLALEGLYQPINSRQQVSYFLDRVLGVQKLEFADNTLVRKSLLGGDPTSYYPVSGKLFVHDKTGLIALSSVTDPLAGSVVHAGSLVMKPASPILVYGQLGIAILWGILILSSILFFLVWGVRKLRGRIPPGATMRIRVWPLLAGVSVLALVGLFAAGMRDPFKQLGAPTTVSVGIMLLSIAFAVFAALGVTTSVKVRAAEMNRVNYWHSSIASYVHALVALYFLWFGVIGLMTWV